MPALPDDLRLCRAADIAALTPNSLSAIGASVPDCTDSKKKSAERLPEVWESWIDEETWRAVLRKCAHGGDFVGDAGRPEQVDQGRGGRHRGGRTERKNRRTTRRDRTCGRPRSCLITGPRMWTWTGTSTTIRDEHGGDMLGAAPGEKKKERP